MQLKGAVKVEMGAINLALEFEKVWQKRGAMCDTLDELLVRLGNYSNRQTSTNSLAKIN